MEFLHELQEERRETDEADESQVVACRKIDWIVVDGGVPDGKCAGERCCGAGDQHDNGSGDGVSGERPAWYRNAGGELANFHDGERPVSCGRQDDGDDCAGWIRKRESCA